MLVVVTLSRKGAPGWNGHRGGEGGHSPPSPKYWRVSVGRMRAAGGLQEHKDPKLVENQLAPRWDITSRAAGNSVLSTVHTVFNQ